MGVDAVAIGTNTTAGGDASFAEGCGTVASGNCSHAEGAMGGVCVENGVPRITQASGSGAHAEGCGTHATGDCSHSEGSGTTAEGDASHSEGCCTTASANCSHAEGGSFQAVTAILPGPIATGVSSHAEGISTEASGIASHAEGGSVEVFDVGSGLYDIFPGPIASGDYSHAEGIYTMASGIASHAEGGPGKMSFDYMSGGSIEALKAAGRVYEIFPGPTASGVNSHAEGMAAAASGFVSHAEGCSTTAEGLYCHAEGYTSTASGEASHAEGYNTTADGFACHAEGAHTTASYIYSHAEGRSSASGEGSHAEGMYAIASGEASHAEGYQSTASGVYSHAEGQNTIASGRNSHAAGIYTIAEADYQTAIGSFNIASPGYLNDAFIIGNGNISARSNAFRVQFNGDVHSATGSYTAGADYAEMFEWQDGNPDNEDRRGYFVTVYDRYIRKATDADSYILGVVSGAPSVAANAHSCGWKGMYLRDEFGAVIYELTDEQREVPDDDPGAMEAWREDCMKAVTEARGPVVKPDTDELPKPPVKIVTDRVYRPKLNPDYDPARKYLPRNERKEWAAVGVMGQLIVRDDGSCLPNGFCRPGDNGVATASEQGSRVLSRIDENKVLVFLK